MSPPPLIKKVYHESAKIVFTICSAMKFSFQSATEQCESDGSQTVIDS